ncbi:hypothetical protein BVRB_2g038730 isoform A [Beta vulgaris subsp. vulgaris]|nr:hypothetical protein BVRB_2g038730 isoform A [Beta vulgaris subsp. vulgaris]
MAENESPNLQLDDLSPEVINLSKVQDKPTEVPFGMLGSATDEEYAFLTPALKLSSQNHDYSGYNSETFPSSGSGSSDISTREISETLLFSSSSSDAESGTYDLPTKNHSLQHGNGDEALQPKVIEVEFDTNAVEENLHMTKKDDREDMIKEKDIVYEELLEKVASYEVELKLTKEKLQSSQEEISKLKYENMTLVEELGGTIEKLRISEDNMGKMEKKLRNEFDEQQIQFQGKLDMANQSIDLLQSELGSERGLVLELQETIDKTTSDLNDYGRKVEQFKLALLDVQKDFSSQLNEQKDTLDRKIKLLEEQISQYEVEKIEAGKLQEARETAWLDEIKQFNMELSQKCQLVDSTNKDLDAIKLKYDMLKAERDEDLAKVQTLVAELGVRDDNILQMEERMTTLATEHKELLDESEKTQKLVKELRLKVTDQEKELEKQSLIICDRAEEKREAIRQLCFSLEYYRNGYHELCQAFIKHKQPAVLAA